MHFKLLIKTLVKITNLNANQKLNSLVLNSWHNFHVNTFFCNFYTKSKDWDWFDEVPKIKIVRLISICGDDSEMTSLPLILVVVNGREESQNVERFLLSHLNSGIPECLIRIRNSSEAK